MLIALVVVLIATALFFPAVHICGPAPKTARAAFDVSQLRSAMRSFYTEYGKPPPPGEAATVAALIGANEKRIVFFEADPSRLNKAGEYLDQWGTPFRIGVRDFVEPWAYSFGKNRIDEGGAEGTDDVSSWR